MERPVNTVEAALLRQWQHRPVLAGSLRHRFALERAADIGSPGRTLKTSACSCQYLSNFLNAF